MVANVFSPASELVPLTAMPGLGTGSNWLFLEIPKRSQIGFFFHTRSYAQYFRNRVTNSNFQVVLYSSSGKGFEADGSLDQHDLRVTGIDWAPKTNRCS